MLYEDFVSKVIEQDKRNVFKKYDGKILACDKSVEAFYKQFNPYDVEFEYDDMTIRMIPASELSKTLKLYEYLGADVVFADCYSDPIFIKDKAVYMCPHGSANPRPEKLADSFDDFISKVTENI